MTEIVDDQIFQSHDNIMCGWNKHFGQLAHKSDYEKFDIKFLELIEKEREIISNSLEPICRQLLYAPHDKRYALLKST